MRKYVVFVLIFFILFFMYPQQGISYEETEEVYQVIPDEAIRLRILANSDNEADQQLKEIIRDEVSDEISGWVEHLTDIDEARNLIESRIPIIEKTVIQLLEQENIQQNLKVEYGKNVTFPLKLYDSYLYPAGEYEAVLITLGEGKGSNWWCVLFPPLCFLDFSSGATVADHHTEELDEKEEEEQVKVKFFLFEWLGWT